VPIAATRHSRFQDLLVADLKADAVDRLVCFPSIAPSRSTPAAPLPELQRLRQVDPEISIVLPIRCTHWYRRPPVMCRALADTWPPPGTEGLATTPLRPMSFFSAHGVPKSYVEGAGDP